MAGETGSGAGVGPFPPSWRRAGLGALIFPAFSALVVTRALEIILRGSIYRAGYELLYTPLPPKEKRAAKPVVDVVFDRMGDVLGGAVSQLFLALGGMFAVKGILIVTVALAGVAMYITRRLQMLYIQVLEKGLVDRAIELDVDTSTELITRSLLLKITIATDGVSFPGTGADLGTNRCAGSASAQLGFDSAAVSESSFRKRQPRSPYPDAASAARCAAGPAIDHASRLGRRCARRAAAFAGFCWSIWRTNG